MILEYKAGRTPNPDVMCNKEVKFRCYFSKKQFLWELIMWQQGHYAQNPKNPKQQLFHGSHSNLNC